MSTNSSEYKFEFDLSFAKDLSEECMSLFHSKFKLKYGEPPEKLDIQLQRIKDQI